MKLFRRRVRPGAYLGLELHAAQPPLTNKSAAPFSKNVRSARADAWEYCRHSSCKDDCRQADAVIRSALTFYLARSHRRPRGPGKQYSGMLVWALTVRHTNGTLHDAIQPT